MDNTIQSKNQNQEQDASVSLSLSTNKLHRNMEKIPSSYEENDLNKTLQGSLSSSSEENDLSKTLQVSCSIGTESTESTESTDSTNTASGLTTPRSSSSNNSCDNQDPKWKIFYTRAKRTPPKATHWASHDMTIVTANKLLGLSGLDKFNEKTFDSLTVDQQVLLVFMIVKEMHNSFDCHYLAAQALIPVLCTDSPNYKRMMSFVRLGGDRVCPIATIMEHSFPTYIKGHPEWERANTIFNAKPDMKPFIHIQTDSSYVCAFVTSAACLHYCSHNRENDDIDLFKLNMSRYIRDEVTGTKIANLTLTDGKGAYLKDVLAALLKSFGTLGDDEEIVQITTFQSNEHLTYLVLEEVLQDGRPLVFSIEVFPGFGDSQQQNFMGKVSDYYQDLKNRPEEPEDRSYHAVLCVGIKPGNDKQPPMLLVQDSNPKRPFFSIGLDLVMSMELGHQFCTAPVKWKFNPNKSYTMTAEIRSLVCGSPMAVTDNGVSLIAIPKEPARDMSRYLDIVKVNKDGPDVCYVT